MSGFALVSLLFVFTALAYVLGRRRATLAGQVAALHSVPGYYGGYAALWAGLPGLLVVLLWSFCGTWATDELTLRAMPIGSGATQSESTLFLNDARNVATGLVPSDDVTSDVAKAADLYASNRSRVDGVALGVVALLSLAGILWGVWRVSPALAARVKVEATFRVLLMLASTVAILVTIGIVLSLIFETGRFFGKVSFHEFLFGTHWSPQTALRADQVASSGSFGAVPVFTGTLLITAIAMVVAVPVGLFAAIYMTFYASRGFRDWAKPMLEVLAGVPTVVYGFFAALAVAPAVRDLGTWLGLDVASESALAAGLIMGVMIIPFISSLSDDAITAVPVSLRDGSFGLGATRSETIRNVIVPAALPGIMGGFLLGVSRAIGETMIVVMAAGLAAKLTANPLDAVTTVTVQIVSLLKGDQEFDSAKTLSAFALGLVLFIVTLLLNIAALQIVQRYREKYD